MDLSEVTAAFDALCGKLREAAGLFGQRAGQECTAGNFSSAKRGINQALAVQKLEKQVERLRRLWCDIAAGKVREVQARLTSNEVRRLRPGLKTTMRAFRRPILEALVELGGEAPARRVLELVEEKMRDRLNEYDWQPSPSDPRKPRWVTAAQFCKLELVQEGLVGHGARRGIWVITEAGRKALMEDTMAADQPAHLGNSVEQGPDVAEPLQGEDAVDNL